MSGLVAFLLLAALGIVLHKVWTEWRAKRLAEQEARRGRMDDEWYRQQFRAITRLPVSEEADD